MSSRSNSGRYIPPHLRNKQSSAGGSSAQAESGGYDRDRERGESRGGNSRGYNRGGGGGRDNRGGDFSSFNTRGRRDYQNGDAVERGEEWGGRGGGRNQDRDGKVLCVFKLAI